MLRFSKIQFPYKTHNMRLQVEGYMEYPEMKITIENVSGIGFDFYPANAFMRGLEKNYQEQLFEAWNDYVTK